MVFRPAARPLRRLLDLQDQIVADRDQLRDEGMVVYAVGVRDDVNRLAVGTAPMRDDQRREFHRRYGTEVEIYTVLGPARHHGNA